MVEKRQFHQFSRNCQYLHLRLLIISDIIILENKTRLEVDLSVANFLDEKKTTFAWTGLLLAPGAWPWHLSPVWQHTDTRETTRSFQVLSTVLIYSNPENIFFFL